MWEPLIVSIRRRRVAVLMLIAVCAFGIVMPQAQTPAPPADLASLRALVEAGKYLEAEEAGLKAVAQLETSRGPSDLAIAETLDLVLQARHTSRRLTVEGSVALAERALRIKEAALGPDDPRVADTLIHLGAARTATRDHDGARKALERALAIRERATGADSLQVAATLNALGEAYRLARNYPPATQAAERALAIARVLEDPPSHETANALSTLGIVDRVNGNIERSVNRAEEMLVIDERLRGPDHPAIVGTILALGSGLWELGDADRALALHERAIRILERTPGTERRLAFELVSLASQLENVGDYANGFIVCKRGADLAEKITGPNSLLTASALDELAALQNHLGDHAAATAIRQRTLAIWSAQGAETLHVGIALSALAESYEDAGQFDLAMDAVDRALRIKALDEETAALSRALQTKARLLSRAGRRDEARVVLQRSREVTESFTSSLAGRADLAMTLREMARIEEADGHPDRAVPLYRDAVRLFEQELGPTYIRTAERRSELAGALAAAGMFDDARKELMAAEQASVDHLRLIARSLTDRRALEFAAGRISGVDLAMTMATSRVGGARTREDVEGAWQLVIRERTVVLDEMAARQRAVVADADNVGVRERWTALNKARARLANLVIRGPEALPVDQYRALVERTRDERDRAERELAESSAAFRREQTRLRASVRDVIARLPAGAAVVSYVRYTPSPLRGAQAGERPAAYAAFIARAGSSDVQVVALGSASAIDNAVTAWRDRIQSELTAGGIASRRSEASYREAGSAVRQRLWDPVRTHLGTARTVFIIPDGAIHLVDFSTLPTGASTYLVESPWTVHYLLAERDLVQPGPQSRGTSLLALGAPDFDKVDRVAAETPESLVATAGNTSTNAPASALADLTTAATRSLESRSVCDALAARQFAPLPATREEMRHIAALWRQGLGRQGLAREGVGKDANDGSDDVVLLGEDRATEAAFKTLAPGRRVLHLATHGFFLDRFCGGGSASTGEEENPLLRAGLVLAGANRRTTSAREQEDGILTAEEIAGLDLSAAEWAVLSACDTGRGDWQAGEGIVGLRRAFEVAGARTVILSLWPVIDTVASDWMTELYRGKFVRGVATDTAVRDANRALLARRRASGQSTHPLYWSGFIATGDWR